MKIGNVTIEPPVLLAPMAGVSDAAFRSLCEEMGAGAAVTEMVSAKALFYGNKSTEALMRRPLDTGVLGLQLFGSDAEILAEMAARFEDDYDFIDFNMGCPMPKIVNNGEGSALLAQPEAVSRIIGAMARAIQKPLTVKLRLGLDAAHINVTEIAKRCEDAGAAAIAVHARTRDQYYSGKAERRYIREVKEAVSVPVIGNGDIDSAEAALRMLEETGCDALMVGRAARGNPWIFREIRAALGGEEIPPRPDRAEMRRVMALHTQREIADKGERIACRELRKHLAWYTAGMTGGAALRNIASRVETAADVEAFLDAFSAQP